MEFRGINLPKINIFWCSHIVFGNNFHVYDSFHFYIRRTVPFSVLHCRFMGLRLEVHHLWSFRLLIVPLFLDHSDKSMISYNVSVFTASSSEFRQYELAVFISVCLLLGHKWMRHPPGILLTNMQMVMNDCLGKGWSNVQGHPYFMLCHMRIFFDKFPYSVDVFSHYGGMGITIATDIFQRIFSPLKVTKPVFVGSWSMKCPILSKVRSQTRKSTIKVCIWSIDIVAIFGSLMPAVDKSGEWEAVKSQKAFSTACWWLNVFPCKKGSSAQNNW